MIAGTLSYILLQNGELAYCLFTWYKVLVGDTDGTEAVAGHGLDDGGHHSFLLLDSETLHLTVLSENVVAPAMQARGR